MGLALLWNGRCRQRRKGTERKGGKQQQQIYLWVWHCCGLRGGGGGRKARGEKMDLLMGLVQLWKLVGEGGKKGYTHLSTF